MTGRRNVRQATLPPAGYTRDRQPGPGSLAVTVAGESGGTEGVFDFSVLPGPPALLAACAAGFARMAGPDQPWRAAATCANGYKAIREFLRWAAALDAAATGPGRHHPGSAGAMAAVPPRHGLRAGLPAGRPPVAAAGAGHPRRHHRGLRPAHPGRPAPLARPPTRARNSGRSRPPRHARSAQRSSGSGPAASTCSAGRPASFPRPGLREQYRQTQPGTAGYLTGEALDVLQRTGDVPLTQARHRAVTARHARALGGAGPQHTWARLFLTMPEAAALAVLLVCDQGWNRSVLDAMTVPDDMPGAGEDEPGHLPRGDRQAPPPGPRPVLVGEPSRHRAGQSRAADPPGDRGDPAGEDHPGGARRRPLTGSWSAAGTSSAAGRTCSSSARRPATACAAGRPAPGWPAPDGRPVQVSLRRLRRTVQVLIRRRTGPEHGQQVHESAYVLRDPATLPEAEQVAAPGPHRRRRPRPRDHEDADAAGRRAGPARRLRRRPGQQAQALADGTLDTATGACLDFTHSPFGPPGPAVHRLVPGLPGVLATRSPPGGTCPAWPGCTAPWTSCARTVARGDVGAGLAALTSCG